MKKIVLLTLALVMLLGFGVRQASAANYGHWLYLQYIMNLGNYDQLPALSASMAPGDVIDRPAHRKFFPAPDRVDYTARMRKSPDRIDPRDRLLKSPDRIHPNDRLLKSPDRVDFRSRLKVAD